MKNIERYIGSSGGGIRETIFKAGFTETISGFSGKTKLKCEITNTYVRIEDVDDPFCTFEIYLIPEEERQINQLVATVNNKNWQGKDTKHPDIYPTRLFLRSWLFFKEQGYDIDELIGHWSPNSDSYQTYWGQLTNLGKHSEHNKTLAAKTTWLGKLAERLHYPKVTTLHGRRGIIDAYFSR